MLGIGWPSVEALNRIHNHWEDYYSIPKNRNERIRNIFGLKIVSSPVHPFEVFKPGAGRYINLPEKPSLLIKILAFLLIQILFASFARKENQYIDYAYRWSSARKIFTW